MVELYGRRIEVDVAGLTVSELRVAVRLDRQIDRTQDKGTLEIWNLSPANERRIHERGGPVAVRAGYPETVATLFEGEAQKITRVRENLARITKIELGDMVREKSRLGGMYSNSLAGPLPVRDIATEIIAALELTPGPLDAIPDGATFTNWYWSGPADAALDALLRSVECTWFEADGVVRINAAGMSQPDAPSIRVTPATGLVGAPVETDEGAEAVMFQNARVVLGCLIDLESEALSGRWKVVGLRHHADNWSGPFTTAVDLRAL